MSTDDELSAKRASTRPRRTLPFGSWDSHVHIIDEDHWPINEDAPFHPKQATYEDLMKFEHSLGIQHACLIGMSVYGSNNGCMIDALSRSQGHRGVAIIDPDTVTDRELVELHECGFRGVRINLRTRAEALDASDWVALVMKYHARLPYPEWVIQIFVSMPQIADIAPIIPRLEGRKVVFDHLGHPEPDQPVSEQKGCQEMYHMLEQNRNVYVKLSGLYRLSDTIGADGHIRHLLKIAPEQVVWGSDWPHAAGPEHNPKDDPRALQDFLRVDIPDFIDKCFEWCDNDETLVKKIFVDNPRRLWSYSGED